MSPGPSRTPGRRSGRDIDNLKAALDGVDVEEAFLPVVAPGSSSRICNEHYADDEALFHALAGALRRSTRRSSMPG